jgi:hypothetical protein
MSVFIDLIQFCKISYEGNLTCYYGKSEKVQSLVHKVLFLKNQKHAERTAVHVCEVMVFGDFVT